MDNQSPFTAQTLGAAFIYQNQFLSCLQYTNHSYHFFCLECFNSVNCSILNDHRVLDCYQPRRDILQCR